MEGRNTIVGTRTADATSGTITAAPAGAVPPTNVAAPTISGSAREGELLTVNAGQWRGTDPVTYDYSWQRCRATCQTVASTQRYRAIAADVSSALVATVTARNPAGTATATVRTGPIAAKSSVSALKRISPFPQMLIDGRVAGRTTSITTLRLRRVPGGATVGLACRGRGCPFRRKTIKVRGGSSRTVALKRLQRRMRAGTVVVITVRKGNALGKYIRLRFRRGLAPARLDRCVAPRSSKPVRCP